MLDHPEKATRLLVALKAAPFETELTERLTASD
jgi:hypothetical protein